MKWFKHMTDSSMDPAIIMLKRKFGVAGYGVYWGIMEVIGRAINQKSTSAEVGLPAQDWAAFLGVSVRKFEEITAFSEEIGLFFKKKTKNFVVIEVPKMLDLLDEYTAKNIKKSGECRDKLRYDKIEMREDKEEIRKEETHTPKDYTSISKHARAREDGLERQGVCVGNSFSEIQIQDTPSQPPATPQPEPVDNPAGFDLSTPEGRLARLTAQALAKSGVYDPYALPEPPAPPVEPTLPVQPTPQPEPEQQTSSRPKRLDCPSYGSPRRAGFMSCFEIYPVKQGQEEAWCEWNRLADNGTLAEPYFIREKIMLMNAEDSRWARGMAPNFAKWLRGKGWNDEPYTVAMTDQEYREQRELQKFLES